MAKKKITAPAKKDSKAFTVKLNMNVPVDVYKSYSLEELEKAYDLAGARLCYAITQEKHWASERHERGAIFNDVTVAYRQRKGGFTDEQVQGSKASSAIWSYAE